MAFNKNSNGYTFLFAIVMVVLVGAILASLSLSLKPMQKANQAEKKMMNILGAIGVPSERGAVEPVFAEYVTERISIDSEGRQVNTMGGEVGSQPTRKDPFNIDVKKDYRSKAPASELSFPLLRVPEGRSGPLRGPRRRQGPLGSNLGLRRPRVRHGDHLWSAVFDHKTETPGLGAEIKEGFFQAPFKGKKINKVAPHFAVVKGGAPTTEYSVDGITGGTITSKGVGEMVDRTMGIYLKYFQSAPKAQK